MAQQYGKRMRNLFMLNTESNYIPINNGGSGSLPKSVFAQKIRYLEQINQCPEEWMINRFHDVLKDQAEAAAQFIGGKIEQTVLIASATSAFAAIFAGIHKNLNNLQALKMEQNDKVLTTNYPYSCLIQQIYHLEKTVGIKNIQVPLNINNIQTNEQIMQQFKKTVEENHNIKVAFLDQISSAPAFIFPIKQLTKYLKEKGIIVVIDGVQATGQIEINVEDVDADFYIVNFHKWVYAPIAVSALWISKKYLNIINPPQQSNHNQLDFHQRFHWQGMRDVTSFCCIRDAISFYNSLNPKKARDYCHNLAIQGSKRMAEIFKTSVLIQNEELIPNMACVEIPFPYSENNMKLVYQISTEFSKQKRFFFYTFSFDHKIYGRISAQVYNEISDYERVANIFLEELNKFKPKL